LIRWYTASVCLQEVCNNLQAYTRHASCTHLSCCQSLFAGPPWCWLGHLGQKQCPAPSASGTCSSPRLAAHQPPGPPNMHSPVEAVNVLCGTGKGPGAFFNQCQKVQELCFVFLLCQACVRTDPAQSASQLLLAW